MRNVLRKYAVGYINSENLRCRSKHNCYAVMFFKDNVFSWCHLTNKEFQKVFMEELTFSDETLKL